MLCVSEPLLRRIARKVVGEDLARKLWKRIEIIVDIAIIRKPFDVETDVFKPIAEEILRELKYVKSVWLAISPVHGDYRIREYIHLAGEYRSETIYREHGCSFLLDIRRVYISPVLGYDHMRTARMVTKGERILNMFAGIGGYTIVISKYAEPSYVVSIDINEHAIAYLKKNLELNGVETLNDVIHGDALSVTENMPDGSFDRVLAPLPELVSEALPRAVHVVKDGGVIHLHLFVESLRKRKAIEEATRVLIELSSSIGLRARMKVQGGHVIRGIGPRKYHVVLDIAVFK